MRIDETGSTNDDLLESADRLADRTVLFAGHQTAGRGRLDRRWETPPDTNLLVSILFHVVPDDPGELTRRIGLAVVDTVRSIGEAGRVRCALKWPNDVLL
ncbi:MAG: biotin--[acetyl-CoA-carboxylase] ligase, partial [Ilumatobacteraceae bacterium]